jgi:2-keto-4-pentenoate hydratase/2-oxohepta-3-ene-1,7-dioic acid hydratase in catechol pathway
MSVPESEADARPRIAAFEREGRRIGIVLGDRIHDATERLSSVGTAAGLGSETLVDIARGSSALALERVRLLAPLDPGARVFCLALNYRAHADESGGADPGRPVVFHKLDTSIIGPDDDIATPSFTDFLDYEAELAVVIGRPTRRLRAEDWRASVGGYTVMNDVSCRDQQATKLGEQTVIDWFSAKEADGTTPLGPWVVPADQVVDPQALRVRLTLNGDVMQDESTSMMIFDIARIVEFLSERVSLRPGDIIATGTPGGVGKARGIRLQPDDVVQTEVDGIGLLRNRVIAA